MRITRCTVPVSALVLFCGLALGACPEDDARAGPLLQGPRVEDAGGPDARAGAPEARPERPRLRAYLTALRSFERADESLRLTDAQAEHARRIAAEHRARVDAFMEEHREEITELRAMAGRPPNGPRPGDSTDPMGRPDARPAHAPTTDAPADPSTETSPDRREARERLHDLLAQAPSDGPALEALMSVLNEPQREHLERVVRERRERFRRAVETRGGRGVQRRAQDRPARVEREGEDRPARRRGPAPQDD